MTWLIKYWHFVLIGIAILIWIIIDPSYEQKEDVKISGEQQANDSEEIQEEVDKPIVEYMVDIKGAVQNPGVYQVKENDRVKDVIKMAGGLQEEANQEAINLSERAFDEMVIIVPFIGDENTLQIVDQQAGKIKINHATIEDIMKIPGIGEVKANAIIEYRETNGPFKQIEDLTMVSGIGNKTLEMMEEQVQIP